MYEQRRTPEGHLMWEHKVIRPGVPTEMVRQIVAAGLEGYVFVQCIPNIGYVVMIRPIYEDADVDLVARKGEVMELELLDYHAIHDGKGTHPAGLHKKEK